LLSESFYFSIQKLNAQKAINVWVFVCPITHANEITSIFSNTNIPAMFNIRGGNSGASRRRLLKRCGAVSGSGSAKSRIENLKLGAPTDRTADRKCQRTSS